MDKFTTMFSISIPSKTFLLGEYIVLDGGPGLILTTSPYFTMRMKKHPDLTANLQHFFHAKSPAGLWLKKNADFFKDYYLDFFDPHNQQGGFGSSSAEFISVYAAQCPIQKTIAGIEKLLADYFSVMELAAHEVLPSGADLVAQACGNITYWHRAKQQLDSFIWSFQNLSCCLIRTGYKQPTHQALKKLPGDTLLEMNYIVQQGYNAFKLTDPLMLINAVKEYAAWMKRAHCVLPSTSELLEFIYRSKLIYAAKGCGALGADVILILLSTEKVSAFLAWLQAHKIVPVAVLSRS